MKVKKTKFKLNLNIKERPMYQEIPKYAKLGDQPIDGQIVDAWHIDEEDLKPFDPGYYFRTSGEAVAKANKMMADAYKFLGRLQALTLRLKKTKADNKFLEVGHDNHQIICKNKNPRVFKKKKKKEVVNELDEDN